MKYIYTTTTTTTVAYTIAATSTTHDYDDKVNGLKKKNVLSVLIIPASAHIYIGI